MVNEDKSNKSEEVSRTNIDSSKELKEVISPPLKEEDILEFYHKLPGPNFNEEEIKERKLKYKIFIDKGGEYVSEIIPIPFALSGEIIKRKPEGDLIQQLEKKDKIKSKLIKGYKSSSKILIEVAEDYMKNIKNINFNYRNDLKKLKKKIDDRDSLMEYANIRRDKVSEVAEQLQTRLNTLKNIIRSSEEMGPERKVIYEFLINYAHFLLYNPLIVGSGELADLKIDEPGVSEHQGLVYIDGFNTLVYENVGLCNPLIIRFMGNGELESIINEGYDMELIDLERPEKQRAYLLLSQEEFKKYEQIPTTRGCICFELPAKK